MDVDGLARAIQHYIGEEILEGDVSELDADTPLLELGILNSLEVGRLLAFLRREHNLYVPIERLTPENLRSIRSLVEFINLRMDGSR